MPSTTNKPLAQRLCTRDTETLALGYGESLRITKFHWRYILYTSRFVTKVIHNVQIQAFSSVETIQVYNCIRSHVCVHVCMQSNISSLRFLQNKTERHHFKLLYWTSCGVTLQSRFSHARKQLIFFVILDRIRAYFQNCLQRFLQEQ